MRVMTYLEPKACRYNRKSGQEIIPGEVCRHRNAGRHRSVNWGNLPSRMRSVWRSADPLRVSRTLRIKAASMRRPSKAPSTEPTADWHSARLINSSALRSLSTVSCKELDEDCRDKGFSDSATSHSCTRLRKASPLFANSLHGPCSHSWP